MTLGKDYSRILRLGAPILIGQLGVIVVSFADNIMVGRYATDALASAAFVNNVFNIAVLFCLGFSYGLTPLVGAMHSSGRPRQIGSMVRTALLLNVLAALVMTGVMAIVYAFLPRLGQPAELLPTIRPYFVIMLISIVPMSVFNTFTQWSYGIKNTRLPMWIILGCNVVNVAGNYALIYGNWGCAELGLTGAGLSTLTARTVAAVAIVCVFILNDSHIEARRGFIERAQRFNEHAKKLLRTSLPVATQLTVETAAFSVGAIMCGWLGAESLAAFQVLMTIGTIGFMVYYSMGSAVSVLVANCTGTDAARQMRRVSGAGLRVLLVLAVLASLIFVIFGRFLTGLFSSDEAVLSICATLLLPMALYQLCDATQINFANALRGTAQVGPMLWISPLAYIAIGLPVTYLFGFTFGWGAPGIMCSFAVSLAVAGGGFALAFRRATR